MLAGGKSLRTSPACRNTVSCAGYAPKLPQGLPAGSPPLIAALASIGWLLIELTGSSYRTIKTLRRYVAVSNITPTRV
jgi:hypothetical protein